MEKTTINDPFVNPTKNRSTNVIKNVYAGSNIAIFLVASITSILLILVGVYSLQKTRVLTNFASSIFQGVTSFGRCRELYAGCKKCVKSDNKPIFVNCGENNPPPFGLKLAPEDIPPKETENSCQKPLPPAPIKLRCDEKNKAKCTWENMGEGVAYTIRVKNKSDTKNTDVIPVQLATNNFIEFPINPSDVYECEVASSIYCGSSDAVSISGSCASDRPTPIAALEIYHTPTPSEVPPGAVDISISNLDLSDPVVMGATLTYQITVKNNGYISGHGVVLTDLIPSTTNYISAIPSKGSCSQKDGVVTCDLGTIEPNVNVDIKISVSTTNAGSLANFASVKALEKELNISNNTESAQTTVSAVTDLMVMQMDSPDPITVNNQLTYTVLVSNIGNASATGVTLTDNLPSNIAFNNVNASQGSCSFNGGVVGCNLGNIPKGNFVLVTILVTPNTTGSMNNTVSVVASETDQNSSNNSSTVTSSIITTTANIADLQVNTNDSFDPVNIGDNITYGITVRNNGSSSANNVVVTDLIPASLTYLGISTSQGSCSFMPGNSGGGGIAICNLGTLSNSQVVNLSLNVKANFAGRTINVASVSGNETDINTANNTDNEETVINPIVDIDLNVADRTDPIVFGDELAYDLGVKNLGPADATGVKARGTAGSGLEVIDVASNNGVCNLSAGTFSCDINNLVKDALVRIIVRARSTTLGVVRSAFEVSQNEPDKDLANNTKQEDTSILESITTPTPIPSPTTNDLIIPTFTPTLSPIPNDTVVPTQSVLGDTSTTGSSQELESIVPPKINIETSTEPQKSDTNPPKKGASKTLLLLVLALGIVGIGMML